MAIVVCPNCGKNTLDAYRVCIHCGANLPPKKKPKEDKKDEGKKK